MPEQDSFATTPRHRASRGDGPDLLRSVVQTIGRTLKESRGDFRQLTLVERHVQRTDIFDSYVSNDGLDGFFANVPLPEVWQETEHALKAVGAAPVAEIFRRARVAYVAAEELEDEGERNQAFLALDTFRRQIDDLGIELEQVLREYIDQHYPWQE